MGLRQLLRRNPSTATEIWTLGSRIQHPKSSVKIKSTSEGSVGDPFMPSKAHVPKFSFLRFVGLVHEPITYIFSNKINYLVKDFMSLEVLVMVSLSCDQNLGKKGIYCPLAFRCQPLVLFTLELAEEQMASS